jgi:dihydrofolate synthase/folylpolyglutamate synthase
MKLGLRNIRLLLRSIGNPHHSFPSVHIAGTNGKGSTSSMIAAILTASGYRVGLYTSPHLVRFNERIRINGKMISNADLVRCTNLLRPKIEALHATFFEATTAIAFKYFQEQKVDIAVIETGLGGRLDATNVLCPLVSVITTIGKDHTEQLGTTLKEIAFEKGGIIKRGTPCVVGAMPPVAFRVLKKKAERSHARFLHSQSYVRFEKSTGEKNFQNVFLSTPQAEFKNIHLALFGSHQLDNLRTAITALEQLEPYGFHVSEGSVQRGLSGLSQLTGIHGRLEILAESPFVILDVAHNPDGIKHTAATIQSFNFRKLHLVFGVMKDKDFRTMIRMVSTLHPIVYAVQPKMERALEANEIVHEFFRYRCAVRAYRSVEDGMNAAIKNSKIKDMILITGSHYVAGDAWKAWKKKERKNS